MQETKKLSVTVLKCWVRHVQKGGTAVSLSYTESRGEWGLTGLHSRLFLVLHKGAASPTHPRPYTTLQTPYQK